MRRRRWWPKLASLTRILLACLTPVDCGPRAIAAPHQALLGELAQLDSLGAPAGARLSIASRFTACFDSGTNAGTNLAETCEPDGAHVSPPKSVVLLAAATSTYIKSAPNDDAFHTAALIDLTWSMGERNAIDRAIYYLHTAATLGSHPANVYADLSAAYLARAQTGDATYNLFEAVEYASLGLGVDSTNIAARYNLALALQRLGLLDQAHVAWSNYLVRDDSGAWFSLARRTITRDSLAMTASNVDSLVSTLAQAERLATLSPELATRIGLDRILGLWGLSVVSGKRGAADSLLAMAEALGQGVSRSSGDSSLVSIVHAIQSHAGSRSATRELARGHAAFMVARTLYNAGQYRKAGRSFERALRSARLSPQLTAWAMLYHAATIVYDGRLSEGERALRNLATRADARRYPALAGHAWWYLGTTLARQGLSEQARTASDRAAVFLERSGEPESAGAALCLTMEAEFALGRTAEAFSTMRAALRSLAASRRTVWLHDVLYIASRELARQGLFHAALAAASEDVAVASGAHRVVDELEARTQRAELYDAMRADNLALPDVQRGRQILASLGPHDQRGWFEADLQLAQAVAWTARSPGRAVASLDSVVAYFSAARNPARLLPAIQARTRAELELGDITEAKADLDRATIIVTRERRDIMAAPLRESLLAATRALFDQATMLDVDRGDSSDALSVLDLARTALGPVAQSRSNRTGRRLLVRSGQSIVDYALIGDTLLIWALHDSTMHFVRQTVSTDSIASTIATVRAGAESRASDTVLRRGLAFLFRNLVAPVRSQLEPTGTEVTVVADGELGNVPFAALLDPDLDRYLIQDHPLRVAFSFALALRPPHGSVRNSPSALIVADPAFDSRRHPGLQRLIGARSEAQHIETLYVHSFVLLDSSATRQAVMSAMRRATLVHVAAHALFNARDPELSQIVLAHDGQHDDALTAGDIAKLRLPNLRLAVLSACETVGSPNGSRATVAGLAWSFLAAGAGGVVGSLWRVDDGPTADLMVAFHEAYRRTGSPDVSLRDAQLKLLTSPDAGLRSPATWAAFQYVGQ